MVLGYISPLLALQTLLEPIKAKGTFTNLIKLSILKSDNVLISHFLQPVELDKTYKFCEISVKLLNISWGLFCFVNSVHSTGPELR